VTATWSLISGADSYTVQWSQQQNFGTISGSSPTLGSTAITYTSGNINKRTWWFRVGATNVAGTTWSNPMSVAAVP